MTQRLHVLKYLANQKYATLEDLYIGSGSGGSKESFRVSAYQFGLNRFSFPAVPGGVWHIAKSEIFQELEQVFPQEPIYKSTEINFNNELLKVRKEVFSKGIFNEQQEIFQIIKYEDVVLDARFRGHDIDDDKQLSDYEEVGENVRGNGKRSI